MAGIDRRSPNPKAVKQRNASTRPPPHKEELESRTWILSAASSGASQYSPWLNTHPFVSRLHVLTQIEECRGVSQCKVHTIWNNGMCSLLAGPLSDPTKTHGAPWSPGRGTNREREQPSRKKTKKQKSRALPFHARESRNPPTQGSRRKGKQPPETDKTMKSNDATRPVWFECASRARRDNLKKLYISMSEEGMGIREGRGSDASGVVGGGLADPLDLVGRRRGIRILMPWPVCMVRPKTHRTGGGALERLEV